jgi:uncharacterized SAM-binding protein YcdF (DUF218 family)
MFRRILSLIVLVWMIGFLWFAIALPQPVEEGKTDAVIVLTGGEGRIARGLDVLREGQAKRLLVSGVDRDVKPGEFAAEYDVSEKEMDCCVRLGFRSYDTQSNAVESAEWIAENRFRSVRLVTTDWHMRRAALDLEAQVPDGVRIVRDAVSSEPSLRILFLEYHKFIAREVWQLVEGVTG